VPLIDDDTPAAGAACGAQIAIWVKVHAAVLTENQIISFASRTETLYQRHQLR